MTTSVVIPAYNGQRFLSANLPAVMALKANEVIVVDDASTDGTADFLDHLGGVRMDSPEVKVIRHPQNVGFPQTVKDGFAAASGDIVFLLNQDVVPAPDLIKKTSPHFKNPKVFAVTFNENDRSWAKTSLVSGLLEHVNGPLDHRVHSSFWASGGGSAFRKIYWDRLGGFDGIFSPGYDEDLDLGWRAWRAGFQIIWDPKALITHARPESTFNKSFDPTRLQRLKDRNFLMAHWKNLDPGEFPAHIISILRRVLAHPGYAVPLIQALPHLPHILVSRRPPIFSNAGIFTKFT